MIQGAAARAYPGAAAGRASPFLSALYLACAGLIVARVALSPLVLDLAISYTSDAGSIVEKIHPATWALGLVTAVALASLRVPLDAWETRVVRAMLGFLAAIAAVLVGTALAGRGGSAGFLIDSYASVCLATCLFLFPHPWRRWVGDILVVAMTVSACVAIVEFALKTRFLPFDETETSFRPIGLSSHPLSLGLWTATAIPFCAAASWSRRVRIAVIALLVLGLAASGARTATIFGLSSAVLIAVAAAGTGVGSRRRLERRVIVAALAVAAVPLLIGVFAAVGALDRFGEGLADANARTRVDIYGVFAHMSWGDILVGMDPAAMRRIAKEALNLEFVESAPVIFVTLFGALGTALLTLAFAWLMRVLLNGASAAVLLACVVFFGIALSSNALSSKGSAIFMLVVLIIAYRPPQSVRPVAADAGRHAVAGPRRR